MGYLTVKNEARTEFEEKKSIFIGHALRVYSEDDAKDFINRIKSENKEARHNVYAYVIGENMGTQRYSDDGEPQGTGGLPVLEVIKKNEITDVVLVVTRYFGGILLGKGGLVRAYSKAAAMAVKEAGIVERVMAAPVKITLDYDSLGKLQYLFEQSGWFIEDTVYTDKVEITAIFQLDQVEPISSRINDVLNGKCVISEGDSEYYFKGEGRLSK